MRGFARRCRGRAAVACALVAALAWPLACRAGSPFRLDAGREAVLLGAGAAIGVAALVIDAGVEPLSPDEIARLDPGDINGFDRNSIEPYRDTFTGDALAYASYAVPLSLVVYGETRDDWRTLGMVWMETVLLNAGLNGVVKGLVARPRPYVYDPDTPIDRKTTGTARLSFYSGHTSMAAANCVFVATVLDRYLGNRSARALVWTAALAYPAVTGYLRHESGHHFRTDVMAGYAVGALIGWLVPTLHAAGGDGGRLAVSPAVVGGGAGAAVRVRF